MFGNLLYFIVALFIYYTYPYSQEPSSAGPGTLLLFLGLTAAFAWFTWLQFRGLVNWAQQDRSHRLDHQLDMVLTRQSIMALVLFAVDVYGLNLPSLFSGISLFAIIPTLQALLFMGLFLFYLSIVWACSHEAQRRIRPTDLSRQSYVLSNILFSFPVLLPWLLLYGLADIINALPFEQTQRFLSTTAGQILYFMAVLFGIVTMGPALIQKSWRCRPLEDGFPRRRIENLCRASALAYSDILYWPIFGGHMITAGVMGLVKRFRYILVTNALLRYLEPEEIDTVIAHEIGHVKRRHLHFYIFLLLGCMLLFYFSLTLAAYAIRYLQLVYDGFASLGDQGAVTSVIQGMVLITTFLLYFRYVFGYFMRNFERQADNYVFTLFATARPLISTLRKIALTSGQSPDKPNWHHFSIRERMDNLERCERDRAWIAHHDGVLRRGMAVYMVGMISVGLIGYSVSLGEGGRKMGAYLAHLEEKRVLGAIERTPERPELYSRLGYLYHNRGNYEGAVQAYMESLAVAPENPEALNNLAWLYATCEDDRYRDPEQAVYLAEKAVALDTRPHILDTLAESYYVNGQFAEAATAGTYALRLAQGNRFYYRNQLDKFMEAKKKPAPF